MPTLAGSLRNAHRRSLTAVNLVSDDDELAVLFGASPGRALGCPSRVPFGSIGVMGIVPDRLGRRPELFAGRRSLAFCSARGCATTGQASLSKTEALVAWPVRLS